MGQNSDYITTIDTPNLFDGLRATAALDIIRGKLRFSYDGTTVDAYIEQSRGHSDKRRVARIELIDPLTEVEVGNLHSSSKHESVYGRIHLRNEHDQPMPIGEYSVKDEKYHIVPVIGTEKRFDRAIPMHPLDYFLQRYAEALSAGKSIVNANHMRKYGIPLERIAK